MPLSGESRSEVIHKLNVYIAMERRELTRIIVATAFITAAVVLLIEIGIANLFNKSQNTSATIFTSSSESVVVDTVKKVNPAVVAITISKNVPVYERYYQNFFGFVIPQIRQRGTELQEVGGGSGFLISANGYIVTNQHVVDDPSAEYTVFLNDGKQYKADIIHRDESLDLAIIKIAGNSFPYLSFGDSDKLEVGQSVIAIGNALAEFRNTVSLGIVSGLSRSITASDSQGQGAETLDQLIQTDAAVNPGNSGGPLLDLTGKVVGINVAVATEGQNIGFALSSNSVKKIIESLRLNI